MVNHQADNQQAQDNSEGAIAAIKRKVGALAGKWRPAPTEAAVVEESAVCEIAGDDLAELPARTPRTEMIEQIQLLNTSATAEWLATFSLEALKNYLDHLHSARAPRGSQASCWVRPNESRAVEGYVLNDQ